ncbi:unnamed protein product [Closterium sp. Yama58-4]|nr:unnamed protein product [Closterium sp. Yama58-4]
MGNCCCCFRGDEEARTVKAAGSATSAQQAETAGAPQPSHTPSSVAGHRQPAPLHRQRSHPSEVVPVDPSPSPPPPPLAEELSPQAESSLPAQFPSARTSAGLPPLRAFSYAELHAATGGFAPARVIGEGGFGKVYRGRMVLPQAADGGATRERELAVKVTNGKQFTERDLQCFEAEVVAMSAMNHPNILRLEGVAMDMEQRPILVYELIPGGDVRKLLQRVRRNEARFSWRDRVKVALGCAKALAIIHENRFIHRDFKSSNVLLREDFTAVLADFGLARTIEDWKTHVSTAPVGSLGYIDPNYFQTGQLSQQSDTYAFGVFLLELIFGYAPLDTKGGVGKAACSSNGGSGSLRH